MKHAGVLAAMIGALGPAAVDAQSLPCFEEFHQIYEYDDKGRMWLEVVRPSCGGKAIPGDPGSKGLHRGRIEVRRSGSNIYFHEDTYTWIVEHQPPHMCTAAREVHNRTTKVVIDGKYFELTQRDGKPPRRKQEERKTVNIPNIPKPPADFSRAPFQDLGTSTIAGHSCVRYRAELGPGSSSEFCVMRLAPKCPAAQSLLSLEQKVAEGNQHAETTGRTTFLKTGRRGEVLAEGAISPP
jgi:hypothetical protein